MGKYLVTLNENPLLPLSAKRAIHEAVVNQETDLRELTETIKTELGLQSDSRGHYLIGGNQIVVGSLSGEETVFQVFAEKPFVGLEGASAKNRAPQAFVEDTSLHADPEENLVHELAHIRLIAFLDRNFQKLAKKDKLPKWALIELDKSPGTYGLLDDFYVYLSERSSYEIQFQYLKSTLDSNPSYRDRPHPTFGDIRNTDEVTARKRILAHIRSYYPKTRDPRFQQFDSLSVAKIFLGVSPEAKGLLP